MDTKQKKRSGDPRAQRRKTQSAKGTVRSGKQARRRPAEPERRTKRPAQPNQAERRRADTERRVQNPGQTARQPAVTSANAEEMVFRPGQEQNQARTRTPEEKKRAAQRRRSAQRTKERQKQAQRSKNRPAVVYTQPKPLNLNRLLLQIAVVLAVVLAITMGLSVFFKVEKVVVYGNNAYSAWTIQEASGIESGERLLSINNARASGKITAALPYVEKVRIGIKLPDTVNIYITEFDVAYAINDQNEAWWLITSSGKVVEQIDSSTANNYTKVKGVQLDTPVVGEQGKAVEVVQQAQTATDPTSSTEETAPVTVTGASRLEAALVILQSLELNDIVGEVASVDVSSLSNIELWYGQRFQVKVGDTSQINKKLSWMKQTIEQRNDYEMGILDVSFTTWTDQVGYTPNE